MKGLLFGQPIPAFSDPDNVADPYVLRMPNGSYRMDVHPADKGIISASSNGGLMFDLEDGDLIESFGEHEKVVPSFGHET